MPGTVKVEGDKIVFELHGVDEILALKRRIEVPLAHVLSVSTEKAEWNVGKQIRVLGTGLYGAVKDGTFLAGDGTVFFEMHHPDKCITVTLDHDTYKRIVFEVEDKRATAKMINAAIGARSS